MTPIEKAIAVVFLLILAFPFYVVYKKWKKEKKERKNRGSSHDIRNQQTLLKQ